MGHQGEHHKPALRIFRYGTCYRWDPDAVLPEPFVYEVGDEEGVETWWQGTVLVKMQMLRMNGSAQARTAF